MLEEIVKAFRKIVKMFRQTGKAFGQNITALEKPLTVSFVKDNKLSLVYVFPKKKVTYLEIDTVCFGKKVMSDNWGLVDFVIGLVIFVLNLPDGYVILNRLCALLLILRQ